MKIQDFNTFINENLNDNRCVPGNVLEIELQNDGHFFWYSKDTPEYKNHNFDTLNDWEVLLDELPDRIFIKIGNF